MRVLLFFLLLGNIALAQQTPHLTPSEFDAMIKADTSVVVIDLRTPKEVESGMIAGAVQMDYFGKNFLSDIRALDPEKTYLIYCASGGRSSETVEIMTRSGIKNVFHLESGFAGWKAAGLPIAVNK